MQQSVYRGLCSTCKGRDTCTYPRPTDRAVLFCAEHDGYEEAPLVNILASISSVAPEREPRTSPMKAKPSRRQGLCAICENRETCTFPKSAEGVWQCEEFK